MPSANDLSEIIIRAQVILYPSSVFNYPEVRRFFDGFPFDPARTARDHRFGRLGQMRLFLTKWTKKTSEKKEIGVKGLHEAEEYDIVGKKRGAGFFMKKRLSITICLCCMLAALLAFAVGANAATVDSGTCGTEDGGENVKWTLDDAGTLTISGKGGMCQGGWHQDEVKKVVIKNGVTAIGSYSFYNCYSLKSVTIPDSVTFFGQEAFGFCESLTEVAIPDNLNEMEWSVFNCCRALEKVTIGKAIERFRMTDFGITGDFLKTVVVTDSATSICANAFSWNNGLTSVTIPDSVKSIGEYAFSDCRALTEITVPDGVTSIEQYTFSGCEKLEKVVLPDCVTSIGTSAFSNCVSLTAPVIPGGLTEIGPYTYQSCTGLTELTIPENVTSIGEYAFYGCTGLTELTIPESVTEIREYAFGECAGLKELTVVGSMKSTKWGIFYGCSSLEKLTIESQQAMNSLDIPRNSLKTLILTGDMTEIKSWSFSDYTSLVSVKLPDSVVFIKESAFRNCSSLTEIELPEGLLEIGYQAFEGCTSLASLSIPASVTSIGYRAFNLCPGFASLQVNEKNEHYYSADNCIIEKETGTLILGCKNSKIPADGSVTGIGEFAFGGCTGLTSVTIPASVNHVYGSAFGFCSGLKKVTVASDNQRYSVEGNCLIESDGGSWRRVVFGCENSKIPENTTEIGEYAFSGRTGLKSVTIPEGVSYIGYSAFEECTGLTKVTIPKTVGYLDGRVFCNCTGLTSVKLQEGLQNIGYDSFRGCTGLTKVTIPKSVTYIGGSAFENCTGLTSVKLQEGLERIEYDAFFGCTGLTEVTIPNGVTYIGSSAFYGCTSLSRVTVADSVEKMEWSVFGNTPWENSLPEGLTYVGSVAYLYKGEMPDDTVITLREGTKGIADGVFSGRTGLTKVTIPDGVTNIGSSAFNYCKGLTSVEIPDSVTEIRSNAFQECSGLKKISLPGKRAASEKYSVQIGYNAFSYCTGLTSVTIPAGVAYLDGGAFSWCPSINSLTVDSDNPYYYSKNNCVISKSDWNDGQLVMGCNASVIPNDGSITAIGSRAFFGCPGLTSVTIPEGVTYISYEAFYGCAGLTAVTIPDGVTVIEGNAFYNCENLAKIVIPASVEQIGWSDDPSTIPEQTVIYGYVDSYAQKWAAEYNRAFEPIGAPAIKLYAPTVVDEPVVNVYGVTNPGVEVLCFVNDTQAASAHANISGRWNAAVPLTGVNDGETVTVKVVVTVGEESSEKSAKVTYRSGAVTFREFTMNHRVYSVSVNADNLGGLTRNITFVPGHSLNFRVAVSNSSLVEKLYIVSTKGKESKRMELTYHALSDNWFAAGFFDRNNKNYVPGTFTIVGTDKNGKEFDLGVTIRIIFLIDPSGYAYEAVQSNKLEGVTAMIYYKDADGNEKLWDAEAADQLNPIVTLEDGAFSWVVPEGTWQVRLIKEGYEDAASEWMDVPPEYTNVYIPMVSQKSPEVAYCNVYADHAEITFSQYMNLDSVNTNSVVFDGYTGTIEPIDRTETAEGSGQFYATAFTFTPDKPFEGKVTVSVYSVYNYAGRWMNSNYSKTVTVAKEPKNLKVSQDVTVKNERTAVIEISAENAAGKTVSFTCDSANIELSDTILALDKNGKTKLTVTGLMPGTATISVALNGTGLTAQTQVTVVLIEESDVSTGDVDGDGKITSADARLALRASVKLETYRDGTAQFVSADVDKDGKITSADARTILRVSVKLETFKNQKA